MHMRNMYIIAIIMLLTKLTERIMVLLSSKLVAIIVQHFSFVNLFFKKFFLAEKPAPGKKRAMMARSAAAGGEEASSPPAERCLWAGAWAKKIPPEIRGEETGSSDY